MRNIISNVVSALFHISTYSGKDKLSREFIKSNNAIMKMQKSRHKILKQFALNVKGVSE